MEFKLSQEDYNWLLLALGYAAGGARKDQDEVLFGHFIRIANVIGSHSPNFQPYEVPK